MKSSIKNIFLALGAVAVLSGCDENSWNDKLDGFEEPKPGTSTSTVEYTLTDADYTKIATKNPYLKYAADHEQTDALKLIGSSFSFTSEAEAREYLPMFLRDSTNAFFAMANGSAVKLTYNVSDNISEEIRAINSATGSYTLSEADYQKAWGSDEDYINAFCPATPASRNIASVLHSQFPDAQAGDYVVVTYNEASENPIFGTIGGGDTPAWEMTEVLGDCEEGDYLEVKGVVTAINSRGFILTDAAGSILCYQASGFSVDNVAIGNQLTLEGEVGSYNTGYQIAITDESYRIDGTASYTYPAPTVYTGAMMDEAITRTGNYYPEYVTFTGKASVSGNYYNFDVDGAETARGSGYMVPENIRAMIEDGNTYKLSGYFITISGGKYFNIVITSVEAPAAASAPRRAPVNEVVTTVTNAIYRFDGSAWSVPSATVVLQPADYTAMGESDGDLSGTQPAEFIPIYLAKNYAYAQADDKVTVVYNYYANSEKSYRATGYTFDGSSWVREAGQTTSQFVRQNGFWVFNPSVVITLPYARNTDPSYTYYMACVNWVFEHVSKEMGGTSLTDSPFIDYRGNAEFYSGASAYYGNVDIRAVTALNNAPEGYTGYEGLTNEEITEVLKQRFCLETMRGALESMFPDVAPIAGVETTYTINFVAYTGAAENETIVYCVSAPGKFSYKSCTWYENGEDEGWE